MAIDPHAHLRDGKDEFHKERIYRALRLSLDSGIRGIFEMPNTVPPLTDLQAVKARLKHADSVNRELKEKTGAYVFHGLYAGITGGTAAGERNKASITGGPSGPALQAVEIWRELFPRVVGLKLYAGPSTGGLGVVSEDEQRRVYRGLALQKYTGVLAVHCEKASLFRPDLWNPEEPESHSMARPPEAETRSVEEQIYMAEVEGFRGVLHICHVTLPETVALIRQSRRGLPFRITCGATPHHLFLSTENMKGEEGLLLKVNPPLRSEEERRGLLGAFLKGEIEWLETDHAPHTVSEKLGQGFPKSGGEERDRKSRPRPREYPSGLPVLHFYHRCLERLAILGLGQEAIMRLTFKNILEAFNMKEDLFPPELAKGKRKEISTLEYGYDPFGALG